MKYCPNRKCAEYERFAWSTDKFCNKCGTTLASKELDRCPQCNELHLEHYEFCPGCGFSYKGVGKLYPEKKHSPGVMSTLKEIFGGKKQCG